MTDEFERFTEMCHLSKRLGVTDPELPELTKRLIGNPTGELVLMRQITGEEPRR